MIFFEAVGGLERGWNFFKSFMEGDLVAMAAEANASEGLPLLASAAKQLPLEVITLIAGYLPPSDAAKVSMCCRAWSYALHPSPLEVNCSTVWQDHYSCLGKPGFYETVTLIDQSVWESVFGAQTLEDHGITFSDDSVGFSNPEWTQGLMQDVVQMMRIPTEARAGPGIGKGITVLTMPRGLTFNKLDALVSPHKECFSPFWLGVITDVEKALGDSPNEYTCRMVMTDSVIVGSRNKTREEQERIVTNLGCELPKALGVATQCFLRLILFSERLYGDHPWTDTRCEEKCNGFSLGVGGFAPAGLSVSNVDIDDVFLGVAALRKF